MLALHCFSWLNNTPPYVYTTLGLSVHPWRRHLDYSHLLEMAVHSSLPDPGIEPTSLTSPALAARFFITSASWEQRCRLWHAVDFKTLSPIWKRPECRLGWKRLDFQVEKQTKKKQPLPHHHQSQRYWIFKPTFETEEINLILTCVQSVIHPTCHSFS